MGTKLRARLSKKNPYWIDKNRRLELKYFCLQYDTYKARRNELLYENSHIFDSSVSGIATELASVGYRIAMIEESAKETSTDYCYILASVTKGYAWEKLKNMGLESCRSCFYDELHKFFWILDKKRG